MSSVSSASLNVRGDIAGIDAGDMGSCDVAPDDALANEDGSGGFAESEEETSAIGLVSGSASEVEGASDS